MFYLALTLMVVVVWGPDAKGAVERWLTGRRFLAEFDYWEYKEFHND